MARSPFFVKSRPLTRADELRCQLSELEAKIGRLGHDMGKEALAILPLFDRVSATLASFQVDGQSMRAEMARLETVSAELRRKAGTFLREIGGPGPLQEARRARQPDPADWWWFLDQLVSERRWVRRRLLLRWAAALAVALVLLFVLYQRYLAPDPATLARLRHQRNAESLVSTGDLAGALGEVEQALALAPDDPSLLIFKGGLQQQLGRTDLAEDTFAAAEAASANREEFLLARGHMYLFLQQMPAAAEDAGALLILNPGSAAGYMLLAQVNEQLGDYREAILAYQQAAALADAQGDARLAATARISMGLLMQRMPLESGESD